MTKHCQTCGIELVEIGGQWYGIDGSDDCPDPDPQLEPEPDLETRALAALEALVKAEMDSPSLAVRVSTTRETGDLQRP
jgi:hypothetical protein